MGLGRIAVVAVVLVAFVVVGALAGWLFAGASSVHPRWSISWGTVGFYLGPTTEVVVRVGVPECVFWNKGYQLGDESWLAPPAITYTPSAVTITMQTGDAFDAIKGCPHAGLGTPLVGSIQNIGFILDVYTDVQVQLSEPLGGRALFDGSTSPPAPRTH